MDRLGGLGSGNRVLGNHRLRCGALAGLAATLILSGCISNPDYTRLGGSIGLGLPEWIPIELKLEAILENGTADGVRAARSDGGPARVPLPGCVA